MDSLCQGWVGGEMDRWIAGQVERRTDAVSQALPLPLTLALTLTLPLPLPLALALALTLA